MGNSKITSKKTAADRFERNFGRIDLFKLMSQEEVILGKIEDIPVSRNGHVGRAKASITTKRFIFESSVYDGNGRELFYYETMLNSIESIKFVSNDAYKIKGNWFVLLGFIVFGGILGILAAIFSKQFGGVLSIILGICAGMSVLSSFIFVPRKYRFRQLMLSISSLSDKFVIGDKTESDIRVVITKDSVEKLTLLVKGIRRAQKK